MPQFTHLHCHTQYSLLDGAASIPGLYKKAAADGMKGLAITDHGNMFVVAGAPTCPGSYKSCGTVLYCQYNKI